MRRGARGERDPRAERDGGMLHETSPLRGLTTPKRVATGSEQVRCRRLGENPRFLVRFQAHLRASGAWRIAQHVEVAERERTGPAPQRPTSGLVDGTPLAPALPLGTGSGRDRLRNARGLRSAAAATSRSSGSGDTVLPSHEFLRSHHTQRPPHLFLLPRLPEPPVFDGGEREPSPSHQSR